MSNEVNIEGINEALKVLNGYPTKINTVVKKSMRVAIKPVISALKTQAPHTTFRKLARYKSVKADIPTITYGYLNSGPRLDGKVSDWFKAYWNNYGTMWSRYKNHTFKTPVAVKRRERIGVRFKLFYEKATTGKESVVYSEFQKSLTSEANKLKNDNT